MAPAATGIDAGASAAPQQSSCAAAARLHESVVAPLSPPQQERQRSSCAAAARLHEEVVVPLSPFGAAAFAALGAEVGATQPPPLGSVSAATPQHQAPHVLYAAPHVRGQPSYQDATRITQQIRAGVVSEMGRLRGELGQRQADALFDERRWWFQPVAVVSGKYYSLGQGTAVQYYIGRRMVCEQLPPGEVPKLGFLVFDCAARALEHAIERRGRFPLAHVAVLRVRVKEPRAPASARWPTQNGAWAFRILTPEAVAVEWQAWMADEREGVYWQPNRPAGHCRQCALGDKSCIHARNPHRCVSFTKPKIKPHLPKPQARRLELFEKAEALKVPTAIDHRWYV